MGGIAPVASSGKERCNAFASHPMALAYPGSGHGTTWDQVTKSDEESIHLAKAVLVALWLTPLFAYRPVRAALHFRPSQSMSVPQGNCRNDRPRYWHRRQDRSRDNSGLRH